MSKISSSHWGAFRAEWKQGRVVDVRPFERDQDPSPLLSGMAELYDHPTRIKRPAVRRSWLDGGPGTNPELRGREPFVEVSWDEATTLVAGELQRVKDGYGNEAIFGGSYGWASAGRFHHAKTQLKRLLNLFGGCTDQVNNYSYGAAMVLLPHIVGNIDYLQGEHTSWRSIVENTEVFLAFGGTPWKNAQVESGGCGVHQLKAWTRKAADLGVRTINIGPIRDDTGCWQNAEWWPVRPGTDTALIFGLAHTLFTEDLHDREFLDKYCVGFGAFAHYLTAGRPGGFNADWAGEICEIDPVMIKTLARQIAGARTMISLSWSIQRADFGEQPYWAAIVLAAMLGQHGLPGGGVGFGYGATNGIGNTGRQFRSVNLGAPKNPTGRTIPVARIADILLKPGGVIRYNGSSIAFPNIKLVYWAGGNPFHHHQDINRLTKAWRCPETIVVNEIRWTTTARMSDIVLPTTTTLERNDIASTSRDRYLVSMKRIAEPYAEARDDFAIFSAIANKLGFESEFTENRNEMAWLEHLYEEARQANASGGLDLPPFKAFWDADFIELPEEDEPSVSLGAFRRDPERNPLATPSGKIEISSERLGAFGMDDCGAHPKWFPPREWLGAEIVREFPLHLISNQPRTRLHSQLDLLGVAAKSKIKGREPILINPADASSRGIVAGDVVRLFNARGACLAGAVLTDAIRLGVVQLSTGAWHEPHETIEGLDIHGNPNVLTHDYGTSSLSCGPSAQSVLVEIERFDGKLPEIRFVRPPDLQSR